LHRRHPSLTTLHPASLLLLLCSAPAPFVIYTLSLHDALPIYICDICPNVREDVEGFQGVIAHPYSIYSFHFYKFLHFISDRYFEIGIVYSVWAALTIILTALRGIFLF